MTAILSPREIECLQHAANGLTRPEAAEAMGCSHHTVVTFHKLAFAKLGVTTIAAAVAVSLRRGLIH